MSTTSLLKRYILVAALTMIALAAVAWALETFAGINVGSGAGIVAALVPAMDAGQAYAKRWGKRPENGYAWKISAIFTLLNIAVSLVLAVAVLAALGGLGEVLEVMGRAGSGLLLIITGVLFLVYWGAGRFFFGFGAKNQIKAEERLAAKKQP